MISGKNCVFEYRNPVYRAKCGKDIMCLISWLKQRLLLKGIPLLISAALICRVLLPLFMVHIISLDELKFQPAQWRWLVRLNLAFPAQQN